MEHPVSGAGAHQKMPMEACNISPESQYRGAETSSAAWKFSKPVNLERQEDNDGGGATAATPWSRDKAQQFPILKHGRHASGQPVAMTVA
jgi:hypothetical protein